MTSKKNAVVQGTLPPKPRTSPVPLPPPNPMNGPARNESVPRRVAIRIPADSIPLPPPNPMNRRIGERVKSTVRRGTLRVRFGLSDYVPFSDAIYDAAITGFMAGGFDGVDATSGSSETYDPSSTQGQVFGEAIDTAIADSSPFPGQVFFVAQMCQALMRGKSPTGLTVEDFDHTSRAISAAYTSVTAILISYSFGGGGSGPVKTDGGTPFTIDLNTAGAVQAADSNGSIVLAYSVIIDSSGGDYQTFIGGENNQMASGANNGVLIGGQNNQVTEDFCVVVGGQSNIANGEESAAVGGDGNSAGGDFCGTFVGSTNTASGFGTTCLGGENNTAAGEDSACVGGGSCQVNADFAATLAGDDVESSALCGVAMGGTTIGTHDGSLTAANGPIQSTGDAQKVSHYVLRGITPGAEGGEAVILQTGVLVPVGLVLQEKSYMIRVQATANDGNGNIAGWDFNVLAHVDGTGAAFIDALPDAFAGAPTLSAGSDATLWTLEPSVDGTTAELTFTFTSGLLGSIIPCVATLDWAETFY